MLVTAMKACRLGESSPPSWAPEGMSVALSFTIALGAIANPMRAGHGNPRAGA